MLRSHRLHYITPRAQCFRGFVFLVGRGVGLNSVFSLKKYDWSERFDHALDDAKIPRLLLSIDIHFDHARNLEKSIRRSKRGKSD